ncbi:hypothetical protein MTBBW1_120031 [Desulfamplus magnetovallimortis]|uniref:Uncharacterized protein n=1 Tax=Desulfamplus magnetovallimortis TaxID=1246637 RepID=A0A1W1H5Z7_9BACT|nr:hypothetical protein [Desulfamplus magnetovallimortis]SLM27910.1 hypothetical protein MTBBW1_120031 [Desulfamplus magnetovallimortis]
MSSLLKKIKRLIIKGNYQFTLKAETELESDGLIIEDALESILNAEDIYKILNSSNPKTYKKEKLYIIKSLTYDDILIYTKGKIAKINKQDQFYILISSKRSLS